MSRFKKVATSAKPDDDARDVLSVAFASTPLQPKPPSNDPTPLSNRAAKRVSINPHPKLICFSHADMRNPEYRSQIPRR